MVNDMMARHSAASDTETVHPKLLEHSILGTYYFKTGEKYVGEWANDSMSGKGIAVLESNNRHNILE